MQSRRGFLGLLSKCAAAVGAASLLPSDHAACAAQTPVCKGEPGKTYFRCPDVDLPYGARLYLNGEDVTNRANEADFVAGWVRASELQKKPGGHIWLVPGSEHYEFGRVSLSPTCDARIVC
jgi:hypothetical protein